MSSLTDATGVGGAAAVTDYQYDANGNRTACIQANGVTTANQFDALNRATNIANTVGGTVLYEAGYTYDLIGNRIEVNELNQQFGARQLSYGYDAKYRLVSEVWGNPATSGHSYSNTYDAAGNRLTHTKVVDGVTSVYGYSYDVLNQLNEVTLDGALHNRYTYDLNGNRATKEPLGPAGGPTQVYNWDVSDRLTSVAQATTGGAQSVLFEAGYDYRTRRVLKRESGNETVFRYDGGNAFQEHRDGAMSVEFVRGTGLGGGIGSILYSDRSVDPNGGGAVEFNVYNPVGHVVVQTDDSGSLLNASVYEAFGNIVENHKTGDQGNRLANTKERDASIGLDNHGFRYYDPEIGRYISRDPIGYGDGLNCRLYVKSNPINHIDPHGLIIFGIINTAVNIGFAAHDTYKFVKGDITKSQYTGRMALTGASVVADVATGGMGGGAAVRVANIASRGGRAGSGAIRAAVAVDKSNNAITTAQAAVSGIEAAKTGDYKRAAVSLAQVGLAARTSRTEADEMLPGMRPREWSPTHTQTRRVNRNKDEYHESHHVTQNAAVEGLPGYSKNTAPTVSLKGGSVRLPPFPDHLPRFLRCSLALGYLRPSTASLHFMATEWSPSSKRWPEGPRA